MSSPATQHHTITLKRGGTGFGFNILGGVDNPCYPGDNAIYVAKIREKESAAIDGRLKEGDKILQAGGVSLVNIQHDKAAQVFKNIKNDVLILQIERKVRNCSTYFYNQQSTYGTNASQSE
ncbi:synaptojanin-2-binding protein [Callorhinchus milii]|uniref:synaptojanin-2-binding protein n=1 Tax=Callorhinchus milii TaxID=7868 RepID=UPI001C3F9F39|nr:synaptojanin-2-binding protein [Callorhinchus milii]